MQGKTLRSICMNDNTFEQDFAEYLKAFDDVLKQLLGIEREKTDQKFLNMDGIVAELRKKLKLKDGGNTYIFATTTDGGEHVLLITHKE